LKPTAPGAPSTLRWTEAERLAELRDLRVLDSPSDPAYDDLARIAALVCATPIALVSFVDETRQWFKTEIGFGCSETPLDQSICAYVLTEDDLLVIPDLTADPRTAGNPLVTEGSRIRFYAGAPIRSGAGIPLGSLCVIDTVARPDGLTAAQGATLQALARQLSSLLEHRRSLDQIALRESELAASERRFRVMTSAMPQMVWTTLPACNYPQVGEGACCRFVLAKLLKGMNPL
jgi:GAF domain-containing protein